MSALDTIKALGEKFPGITSSREYKIVLEVITGIHGQLDYQFNEAEKMVEWREKPVALLAVSDDRLSQDELFAAFNERLPMWVVAIVTKDDLRPSDVPARQMREEVNREIIRRGMDRAGHGEVKP